MTTLREAAQQALEALELEMDTRRCKVAIAALRAALAQQDQQAPESTYHPCTFILIKGLKKLKAWDVLAEWDKAREIVDKRLRAAPPQQVKLDDPERRCGGPGCDMTCCQPLAQQAEPAQEPEGLDWRYTARIGYVVKPYTAPPQRDALLEVLKQSLEEAIYPSKQLSDVYEKASAAIKAVEETK